MLAYILFLLIFKSFKKQMQQNQFCEPAPIRFKHFTRKGYSLFACLGRVVIVGTLSASTLTHARAEGVSIRTESASDTLQRSELKLDEVVVTGSRAPLTDLQSAKIVSVITRDDIQRAATASINDILNLVPGVDVRQRGGFGVQTDISVRGGNFDQITILLNGINISSPHTGHLSADFPVSPDDIERIEVLEGPAARVYGTQAFNGVVNIVTRKQIHPTPSANGSNIAGYVNASGGQYGYANANGGVSASSKTLWGAATGGYTRSDGATPNSAFSSARTFINGGLTLRNVRIDAQMGYSYKPYDANTFYGASSTDQWESNERWMAAIKGDIRLGNFHIAPQAFWNRWYDHYQWHKGKPAGENYHKVDNIGGSINAWVDWTLGKTSLGFEAKRDVIWSTKLGELQSEGKPTGGHDANADILYMYHDARTNLSAFLEHNILLRHWTISLGLLANMNTGIDHKWRLYPGIDIAYRPSAAWKLYASWNMALRMPTFTDLYYSGTGIEGNRNLKPEKTSDFQIGARYSIKGFETDIQLFHSNKTNMIDWVTFREAGDNIFHSVNFQLKNIGAEVNATLKPRELWGNAFPVRAVSAKYSYIHEDSNYDVTVISSKYAMDYLRHKVVIAADGRIWKHLNISLTWRWQDRTGSGNESYGILDGRLSWDAPHWSAYIDCNNILNKKYFDYISIPQPGIWARAGITVRLFSKK